VINIFINSNFAWDYLAPLAETLANCIAPEYSIIFASNRDKIFNLENGCNQKEDAIPKGRD
jgi:hypothetical protein